MCLYSFSNKWAIELIKYLYANGCPFNKNVIIFAAIDGRFEIVKYMYENKLYCEKDTISWAAKNEYFYIVKYLHENCIHCRWNKQAIVNAMNEGHLKIVEYLQEKGYCELL